MSLRKTQELVNSKAFDSGGGRLKDCISPLSVREAGVKLQSTEQNRFCYPVSCLPFMVCFGFFFLFKKGPFQSLRSLPQTLKASGMQLQNSNWFVCLFTPHLWKLLGFCWTIPFFLTQLFWPHSPCKPTPLLLTGHLQPCFYSENLKMCCEPQIPYLHPSELFLVTDMFWNKKCFLVYVVKN